jgi:uncharacterized protein (TIGR02246 family)
MQAIVVKEYGGPEVLEFSDYPDPVAATGEVLVRVAATSVNPFDIMRRSGAAKDMAPIQFPGIVGVDVSGTVAEVGAGVQGFAVGDWVFAMAERTYAEFCAVKATNLAKLPVGIDLIEAAALPLVTTTGNQLVTRGTAIKEGQTILVTGAAGNVGRSAVYTAKALGAFVIAAVLKAQLAPAASLGADQVVATDDDEAMAKLPSLDCVADTVAGKTAEKLIAKVKPGGVFATVLSPPANASDFPNVKVVTVYAQPDVKTLLFMADAVKRGKLVIPIGQKIPLEDAEEGHAAVSNRTAHGKVLLVAGNGDTGKTEAEDAIKKVLSDYETALNASNTEAVMPLYAEEGIFMPPYSHSAIGIAAVKNAYQAVFEAIRLNVKFHLAELVITGPDWAFARTNSEGHTTDHTTGAKSAEANQELFIFKKDTQGAWKIARYSFSSTNPMPGK